MVLGPLTQSAPSTLTDYRALGHWAALCPVFVVALPSANRSIADRGIGGPSTARNGLLAGPPIGGNLSGQFRAGPNRPLANRRSIQPVLQAGPGSLQDGPVKGDHQHRCAVWGVLCPGHAGPGEQRVAGKGAPGYALKSSPGQLAPRTQLGNRAGTL
eukprot:6735540-Pyramimonas_sp.AAC.2